MFNIIGTKKQKPSSYSKTLSNNVSDKTGQIFGRRNVAEEGKKPRTIYECEQNINDNCVGIK